MASEAENSDEFSDGAPVRIGLIQHACGPDPSENRQRTESMIRKAVEGGAHIVATQELFHLPYFPQSQDPGNFRYAEPVPGATTDHIVDLAAELDVVIVASVFERRAEGIYHNTTFVADGTRTDGGRITARYRKMHIPDDPRFYEKYYFTPGDLGWQVCATPRATLGLLICWDQWFPEAARCTALRGAQILIIPTAIAWSQDESAEAHRRQYEAWLTVQRGHAIVNGVFVAAINRTGIEDALRFWGRSFVAGPDGAVVAQADGDADEVLLADCPLSEIRSWRNVWPFLRDRRIDAYDDLTQRLID
ncbi:MAG: acyltransferase [Phycisphaeraceae bacterium]|nr:acyltransferase [Phycisphaeraceae bacterium]